MERTKKKLKLKRLKTNETANSVANYCLQTMKIETVAHKNLVLMYIKRQNGNQGYTRPIHSAVTKKENEIPDELKEQGLDVCASNNYLFLCKSHEDDSTMKMIVPPQIFLIIATQLIVPCLQRNKKKL